MDERIDALTDSFAKMVADGLTENELNSIVEDFMRAFYTAHPEIELD